MVNKEPAIDTWNLLNYSLRLIYAPLQHTKQPKRVNEVIMSKFHIIVGTVMGTALEVAQHTKNGLIEAGHSAYISENFTPPAPSSNDGLPSEDETWLICCSNTGMGDLPANIQPFYQHLTSDFPRIAGKHYGIITLGDSSFPNFAQTGQTLDAALSDLGALRVGEIFILDSQSVSEYAPAVQGWLSGWLQQFAADIA